MCHAPPRGWLHRCRQRGYVLEAAAADQVLEERETEVHDVVTARAQSAGERERRPEVPRFGPHHDDDPGHAFGSYGARARASAGRASIYTAARALRSSVPAQHAGLVTLHALVVEHDPRRVVIRLVDEPHAPIERVADVVG